MIHRRSLMRGLIGTLAAPAIIRTPGLLMPIKPLPLPLMALIGVTNDTYFWQDGNGILYSSDGPDGLIPIMERMVLQAMEESRRSLASVMYNE